jgi:hypothetical protein
MSCQIQGGFVAEMISKARRSNHLWHQLILACAQTVAISRKFATSHVLVDDCGASYFAPPLAASLIAGIAGVMEHYQYFLQDCLSDIHLPNGVYKEMLSLGRYFSGRRECIVLVDDCGKQVQAILRPSLSCSPHP